ncbi:MAG TPA: hypothetical protein VJT72_09400 [Pseudonocardiaceae bacterium]|nr:hypothetical protein [Pseudonocardiaceae bacterium]
MTVTCELAQRTRIRAFRTQQYVLIIAEGKLPTPGFDVDTALSPFDIFPPQFNLLRCPRPGIWPQVVTPYRYAETVRFPEDQPTVTVHHADGADQIDIEECGDELADYVRAINGDADRPCPESADQATGFSRTLSFDEAFANARANLPPVDSPGADILERIQVVEIGGLFGGIAGFHDLFVRICRTHD